MRYSFIMSRKSLLFAAQSLSLSSHPIQLFLQPQAFTAREWQSLKLKTSLIAPDSSLTLLRTGLLPAILRSRSFTHYNHSLLKTHLKGPIALLSLPDLRPKVLATLIAHLEIINSTPSSKSPPWDPKSKLPKPITRRLPILSSLLQGRAVDTVSLKQISKLPELEVLHSQMISLIASPVRGIVDVIGVRAHQVGNTLEAFKRGLDEESTSSL